MPTTIIPFTRAATLLEPATKRKSALTSERTKRSRVSSLNESETRLWKVCAEASRREAILELLVLAVLILITLTLLDNWTHSKAQQAIPGSAQAVKTPTYIELLSR